MTQVHVFFHGPHDKEKPVNGRHGTPTLINHPLSKLSPLDLPAKGHFEDYLRSKIRANHKRSTIEGSFTSIVLFLTFYGTLGKTDLKDLHRSDLEAFIARTPELWPQSIYPS